MKKIPTVINSCRKCPYHTMPNFSWTYPHRCSITGQELHDLDTISTTCPLEDYKEKQLEKENKE